MRAPEPHLPQQRTPGLGPWGLESGCRGPAPTRCAFPGPQAGTLARSSLVPTWTWLGSWASPLGPCHNLRGEGEPCAVPADSPPPRQAARVRVRLLSLTSLAFFLTAEGWVSCRPAKGREGLHSCLPLTTRSPALDAIGLLSRPRSAGLAPAAAAQRTRGGGGWARVLQATLGGCCHGLGAEGVLPALDREPVGLTRPSSRRAGRRPSSLEKARLGPWPERCRDPGE